MSENKLFNSRINFIFFVSVIGVICASLVIGLVITVKASILIDKNIAKNEEEARPAELDIIILQDQSCDDCFDPMIIVEILKEENVQINSEKVLEMASLEGQELIDRFAIYKGPTFIVKGEIEKNENLKAIWEQIGDIQDGVFIFRQVMPPYILTTTGEIKGRAKLTMLTDESCEKCYDIAVHESIMSQFGFPVANKEIFDVSSPEGQALVSQYNITLVPTIILTGDVGEYESLKLVWNQVGTIEDDGAYIFREGVKQMGVYQDLTAE